MSRIEASMWLQMPRDEKARNNSKATIMAHLEGDEAFENIMLIKAEGAKEAELSFCFEKPVVMNELAQVVTQSGAHIIRLFLQLPSSLSGIADAYDARDSGASISETLKEIAGVKYVSIGG